MRRFFHFRRSLHWLNLPGAVLLALLQRTPVLRVAITAEEFVVASPVGAVLRSAVGGLASLGALHSLAGATTIVTNQHPSPLTATVGIAIPQVVFGVTGSGVGFPGSWQVSGSIPPGLTFAGRSTPGTINISNPSLIGTPTTAGTFQMQLQAWEGPNRTQSASPLFFYTVNVAAGTPVVTGQPASQTGNQGDTVSLTVSVSGNPTLQWRLNGSDLSGATGATLSLADLQPAGAGLYTAVLTNSAGSVTSDAAIVGVSTMNKVIGTGTELQPVNIPHPNGNIFDQVLLTGAAETITADPGQVTRTSYIDLNDDIVQVEFTGAGTVSLVLDNSSSPARPVNYNQAVDYVKGHAGIVVTGANETTHLSVFTVGRLTAFDPTGTFNFLQAVSATNDPANNGSSLFVGHAATAYDGIADVAFIAISSTNGKFGGLRAAGASCFAAKGLTGIYAPGVQFTGPVFISDITASDTATPVFIIGSSPDTRITGGDLLQTNGRPVQVAGLAQLKFTAGGTSNNVALPAQTNKAVLRQNGADVTRDVVVDSSSP